MRFLFLLRFRFRLLLLPPEAATTAESTAAVQLTGVEVGTGLVTYEVTVDVSEAAAAKVDGVVVNSALDNASVFISCSIGIGLGWYAALAA